MRRLKYERVLFAMLFSFLVASCTQDDETLRFGFQDELGNLISEYDTLKTETYLVYNDSVKSKNPLNSLFGYTKDAVFGVTYAKSNMDFAIPTDTATWASVALDTAIYDSVELVLSYNYSLGDSVNQMPLDIFKLSTNIDIDSNYYIFNDIAYHSDSLLARFHFEPNDIGNQVVKMDDDFGKLIFDNRRKVLEGEDVFRSFLKGITIQPAVEEGDFMLGVNRYSNNGATSYLRIAYRTGPNDTEGENYLFLFFDQAFNHLKKDFTGSELEVLQQYVRGENQKQAIPFGTLISTTLLDNKCYIESSTGISTYLKFPTLKDSVLENADGRYPNDFTISLRPIEGSTDVVRNVISNLVFYYANSTGLNYQLTANELPFLANTLGSTSTLSYLSKGRSYTPANLTGYFHELLIGSTQDYGLQIRSSYVANGTLSENNYSIDRVVFGDGNSLDRPLLIRYYNTRSQK